MLRHAVTASWNASNRDRPALGTSVYRRCVWRPPLSLSPELGHSRRLSYAAFFRDFVVNVARESERSYTPVFYTEASAL